MPEFEQLLLGHREQIVQTSFDAMGQRVVTASYDRTARAWDLGPVPARPRPIRTPPSLQLSGHTGGLRFVAFTRDGRGVITAGLDGQVRRWNLDDDASVVALQRRLRQATTECLSVIQRMHHLGQSLTEARDSASRCRHSVAAP